MKNTVSDGCIHGGGWSECGAELYFIRLFGYIAAGYTTLACYMLYSVGHYIVSKRILVNEGIQENLMSPGFLVACSVF